MRIYGANGTALAARPAAARRVAGGSFSVSEETTSQATGQSAGLRAISTVDALLALQGVETATERKKRAEEALERVGMAHRAKHLPSQLSGGQQQRVAVARAVAGEPLILLADEPTGNLDSRSGEAVMDLMRELHRAGATICMVTHDPRYALHADRSVHLFDGRVVEGDAAMAALTGGESYGHARA